MKASPSFVIFDPMDELLPAAWSLPMKDRLRCYCCGRKLGAVTFWLSRWKALACSLDCVEKVP